MLKARGQKSKTSCTLGHCKLGQSASSPEVGVGEVGEEGEEAVLPCCQRALPFWAGGWALEGA